MSLTNIKDVFRRSSLEILVGAFIGAASLGLISFNNESERDKLIPLGFSEISQLEREADGKVEPIAHYYASTNDIAMKVFEAWNIANKGFTFDFDKTLARELEFKTESTFKVHNYNLKSFFEVIGERSKNALLKFKQFIKVGGEVSGVNKKFDQTWDESHIDTTHIEIKTRSVCDGDGNCHTETYTETVCDYTTHRYRYNKQIGEEVSLLLDSVLAQNPNLVYPEELQLVMKTHAEGEYAAETSREKEEYLLYTQKGRLLSIANTWNTGSNYVANQFEIMEMWRELHSDANKWRRDKETAHDESF